MLQSCVSLLLVTVMCFWIPLERKKKLMTGKNEVLESVDGCFEERWYILVPLFNCASIFLNVFSKLILSIIVTRMHGSWSKSDKQLYVVVQNTSHTFNIAAHPQCRWFMHNLFLSIFIEHFDLQLLLRVHTAVIIVLYAYSLWRSMLRDTQFWHWVPLQSHEEEYHSSLLARVLHEHFDISLGVCTFTNFSWPAVISVISFSVARSYSTYQTGSFVHASLQTHESILYVHHILPYKF